MSITDPTEFQYSELDKTAQINAVINRLRDIERQHMDLNLRVNAPDLQNPPSEMDQQNLAKLEASIVYLNGLLKQLRGT